MRWSFGIGRVMGIDVRVHVTFLLFVLWIAVMQGIQRADPRHALVTMALMLLVFLCVLLHEFGHALAARRYGIGTKDIVLLPIGGVARLERMPEKPSQELVVAIAGPLVNVAIAGLLLMALVATSQGDVSSLNLEGNLLVALFSVNVILVLFNLVPAFPMDGGRVLRALLAMRMPFAKATRIASVIGQAFALLFGLWGLFSGNVVLMFIALFVFLAAGEERALVETRDSLSGVPVRDAMLTDFRMVDVRDPLRRAVEHLMAGSQQDFPVLEDGRPIGVLTRQDIVAALQKGGVDQRVGEVMTRGELAADVNEPLEGAMARMRERSIGSLPVLDRGRLVGVLTLENIGDLLTVRDALRRYASAPQPHSAS